MATSPGRNGAHLPPAGAAVVSTSLPKAPPKAPAEADQGPLLLPGGGAPVAPADQALFQQFINAFTVLAETCDRFSREVYRRSGTPPESDMAGTVERNLKIARTVFEKWSLHILAVTFLNRSVAFEDLQKAIGRIPPSLLRAKLRKLEAIGLVQTDIVSKRDAEHRYSLTHKGQMITRLGEPVFLYLRLTDGWRNPVSHDDRPEASEQAPMPVATRHA